MQGWASMLAMVSSLYMRMSGIVCLARLDVCSVSRLLRTMLLDVAATLYMYCSASCQSSPGVAVDVAALMVSQEQFQLLLRRLFAFGAPKAT